MVKISLRVVDWLPGFQCVGSTAVEAKEGLGVGDGLGRKQEETPFCPKCSSQIPQTRPNSNQLQRPADSKIILTSILFSFRSPAPLHQPFSESQLPLSQGRSLKDTLAEERTF